MYYIHLELHIIQFYVALTFGSGTCRLAGVLNLALRPLELLYMFACSCVQMISLKLGIAPSGHAGMLSCKVNTWSPRCYISCCRKMVILQATIYTIIKLSHYAHCLMLLQCVNTELQPVITELMVG